MAVIKHSDQRVAVFIDTQNLYHSAKNLYNTKVNFGAVMKESVGNRKLIRALAYVITTEAGTKQISSKPLPSLASKPKQKICRSFTAEPRRPTGMWDLQ
jgi:uncharacterized LabA/DUF88 family protein